MKKTVKMKTTGYVFILATITMSTACSPTKRLILEGQKRFTLNQIQAAHAKVKSGADFPAYIRELNGLGVGSYETYVSNGRTQFYGDDEHKIELPAKYQQLRIANQSTNEGFRERLRAHQQGKTDYPTFCNDCAEAGIDKWIVSVDEMTCTYYDKEGNKILCEFIPA